MAAQKKIQCRHNHARRHTHTRVNNEMFAERMKPLQRHYWYGLSPFTTFNENDLHGVGQRILIACTVHILFVIKLSRKRNCGKWKLCSRVDLPTVQTTHNTNLNKVKTYGSKRVIFRLIFVHFQMFFRKIGEEEVVLLTLQTRLFSLRDSFPYYLEFHYLIFRPF